MHKVCTTTSYQDGHGTLRDEQNVQHNILRFKSKICKNE